MTNAPSKKSRKHGRNLNDCKKYRVENRQENDQRDITFWMMIGVFRRWILKLILNGFIGTGEYIGS